MKRLVQVGQVDRKKEVKFIVRQKMFMLNYQPCPVIQAHSHHLYDLKGQLTVLAEIFNELMTLTMINIIHLVFTFNNYFLLFLNEVYYRCTLFI